MEIIYGNYQVPGTIRYLARSGTWHDLVPGTTWYLARPGRFGTWHDQIWYLARSDNYLIDQLIADIQI